MTHPVPGEISVLPPFRSRRHLPSRLARLREMDGRSSVQTRGGGTEFDSLRDYVRGDDVRSIDWRATARRADVDMASPVLDQLLAVDEHRARLDLDLLAGRNAVEHVGEGLRAFPAVELGCDQLLYLRGVEVPDHQERRVAGLQRAGVAEEAHGRLDELGRHQIPVQLPARREPLLLRELGERQGREPGRVIVGNAGVLLTRVIRSKRSGNGPPFVVVDAAMNDLIRPALYDSYHALLPGREPLMVRYQRFRDRVAIPAERVDTVFKTAIAACRARTLAQMAGRDRLVEANAKITLAGFSLGGATVTAGADTGGGPRSPGPRTGQDQGQSSSTTLVFGWITCLPR